MPVKTKAKDHSEYIKHMTHINLHQRKAPQPRKSNTGKKILVAICIIVIIVLIFVSLLVQV